MSPGLQATDSVAAGVAQAIAKASDWLLAQQSEKGYWWGDLTADTTLESDYILLQLWLYPPQGAVWNPPTRAQVDRAVQSILDRQCADGGFSIYPGGPSDVSASVKAYFSLKVAGIDAASAPMTRLRDSVLANGGLQAANSYVKINLSLFDLYPREHVPSVPPEMILMGRVLYHMSAWARAIVVPLAIVQALNAGRPVPTGFTIDELFAPGVSKAFPCLLHGRGQGLQAVGAARQQVDSPEGDCQVQRVGIGPDPLHRWVGRDLPADDVHDHGAGRAGR